MRKTMCRMSLSVGSVEGAMAMARSMDAPADDERPARPAVPAAPSASPPFRSVRRLTRPLSRVPRAVSSALSAAMRSPPHAVTGWRRPPRARNSPSGYEGNGGESGSPRIFRFCSRACYLEFRFTGRTEGRRVGGTQAAAGKDDVVDDPVVAGLFGGHVVVAVDVLGHPFEGLSAVVGDDLGHPPRQREDLAQLDLHVGGRAAGPRRALVDHDARVGQREA